MLKRTIPGIDTGLLLKDAGRLLPAPSRRLFLRQMAGLGSLLALTGCSVTDSPSAEALLRTVSSYNDWVQARLFSPDRLAPEFSRAEITDPFPFNAFYGEEDAPEVDAADWQLAVGGLVDDKSPWTLDRLNTLPTRSQITRHVCIEGWSAIGEWSGPPLVDFLHLVGADLSARYVGVRCEDRYVTSLDMPTALHAQTLIVTKFAGKTLPRKYGFPIKIRVPTKLGFKNPKHVNEIWVTNDYPGGFWEDQGYNWFSGL
ncbi:molybdopterin-dependent oxidoreductase [Labrys okinawensis]|uniref:molybdopterin-dependent oxidoreductase n=1 Tax=Labrys okinawensis TaxID=346911 RepID=UPI0039BD006B